MGNLFGVSSRLTPHWSAFRSNPRYFCRLLAERMDIDMDCSDGDADLISVLRAKSVELERTDPYLWPRVYHRCSRVERIQLFDMERTLVESEYQHLWITCQEPRRMMMLCRWLDEANRLPSC